MSTCNIATALQVIKSLLLPGEEIIHSASQVRLAALLHRRKIVLATQMRVIIFSRRLIGDYHMDDFQWQDFKNASIRENPIEKYLGAEFKLRTTGYSYSISGLQIGDARSLYVHCQRKEQEWREKNRIRAVEEARAKAGGVMINSGGHSSESTKQTCLIEGLKAAKQMLDDGLINDAEYETMKAKFISEI